MSSGGSPQTEGGKPEQAGAAGGGGASNTGGASSNAGATSSGGASNSGGVTGSGGKNGGRGGTNSGGAGGNEAGTAGAGGAGGVPADDCARSIEGMVCFRGATFWMGDDAVVNATPRHLATVRSFYIDITEVTLGDYMKCVNDSFCGSPMTSAQDGGCNAGRPLDSHPVNCVSGHDAGGYCASLGKRLPTEEEWDYAAFGGVRTYPWGEDPPSARFLNANVAWEDIPKWGLDSWNPGTAPVGSFPDGATPEGLLDMGGNLWEWTQSRFCSYPSSPCTSCKRSERCANACNSCDSVYWVLRGSSGFDPAQVDIISSQMRYRGATEPWNPISYVGFRCALDAPAH